MKFAILPQKIDNTHTHTHIENSSIIIVGL